MVFCLCGVLVGVCDLGVARSVVLFDICLVNILGLCVWLVRLL